jgi:hypothetical protein
LPQKGFAIARDRPHTAGDRQNWRGPQRYLAAALALAFALGTNVGGASLSGHDEDRFVAGRVGRRQTAPSSTKVRIPAPQEG